MRPSPNDFGHLLLFLSSQRRRLKQIKALFTRALRDAILATHRIAQRIWN